MLVTFVEMIGGKELSCPMVLPSQKLSLGIQVLQSRLPRSVKMVKMTNNTMDVISVASKPVEMSWHSAESINLLDEKRKAVSVLNLVVD